MSNRSGSSNGRSSSSELIDVYESSASHKKYNYVLQSGPSQWTRNQALPTQTLQQK